MIRSRANNRKQRSLFPKSHLPVFVCYLLLKKAISLSVIARFVLKSPPCFSWKVSLFPGPGAFDDDGLLTASEVAQLKLNADWVASLASVR